MPELTPPLAVDHTRREYPGHNLSRGTVHRRNENNSRVPIMVARRGDDDPRHETKDNDEIIQKYYEYIEAQGKCKALRVLLREADNEDDFKPVVLQRT